MDLGLKDLRCLVAASSSGLGAATALQFGLEGAKVAINGRNAETLAKTASYIKASTSAEVISLPGDISRADDARRIVEDAAKQFGGLDILVTNVGGPPSGKFEDLKPEDWQKAFDLLIMSAVYMIRAALPILRLSDHPSILAITSMSVKQPVEGLMLSNSVRMSMAGMVKSLANELGPQGVRVNAILPGWTRTDRVTYLLKRRAETSERTIKEVLDESTATIPLRRMGEPEEFGRVAAFIASPAASFIHGAMIPVDGGEIRATL
ncbi:MAG: SDR family oxidoreductase [Anaerolineae bacterium]|nr:SDR family oxidoreductase [Anaerolineae bacterium]